jgi:hypothetical protein
MRCQHRNEQLEELKQANTKGKDIDVAAPLRSRSAGAASSWERGGATPRATGRAESTKQEPSNRVHPVIEPSQYQYAICTETCDLIGVVFCGVLTFAPLLYILYICHYAALYLYICQCYKYKTIYAAATANRTWPDFSRTPGLLLLLKAM